MNNKLSAQVVSSDPALFVASDNTAGVSSDSDRCVAQGSRRQVERRLGLSQGHISTQASMTYYEGGRVVRLSHPANRHLKKKMQWELDEANVPINERPEDYYIKWRRKVRGKISKFTGDSRRRMMQRVGEIPHAKLPEFPTFVTLTYPGEWSDDGRDWKEHLERFRSRFVRSYGKLAVIWKLEFQARGAPHFHLLVYFNDATGLTWAFKKWVSNAWYECVDSGDVRHLYAGTQVAAVRSLHGVQFYCAKYMAKTDSDVRNVGRHWGIWYQSALQIEVVRVVLTEFEFYRLRRVLVKFLRRHGRTLSWWGRNQGAWAFMGSDLARRFVAWGIGEPPSSVCP